MDSYIPNIAEPPVPIPYGELSVSIAESLTPEHPITITDPLQAQDFPDNASGAVAFAAFQRIQEIFSHGFTVSPHASIPPRDLWLNATANVLASIHNSIRRTHAPFTTPNLFSDLSPAESTHLSIIRQVSSSFDSFFSSEPGKVQEYEICLRCLEETVPPITKAAYESVLMWCSQNIHAAHRTIINHQLRTLTEEMNTWVQTRREAIISQFIDAVVSENAPSFDAILDPADPRLVEWANRTRDAYRAAARHLCANDVADDIIAPWAIEAMQAAKAEADKDNLEYFTNYSRDLRTSAERRAIDDSDEFYNTTITSLNAEALERAEREVAEYKSTLKVKAEERKEAYRIDMEARLVKLTSSSSSQPITRTNRPKKRVDPITRPLSRSISRSRSRSHAPSPESRPPGRSPDMTTPRASPIVVELPPTRALTEPALVLQPPPTNVSVGPPSNSFEECMMLVDTTALPAVEYPRAASSFEPYGPPNTQAPHAPEASASSTSSSPTEAPTDTVMAAIAALGSQLSSQISALSTRVGQLEQPQPSQPYSPSNLATLWQPNPTHVTRPNAEFQPELPDPNFAKTKLDYTWGMEEAADFNDNYRCCEQLTGIEAAAAQADEEVHLTEVIPEAIRDIWARFEGLDPCITNLTASQFTSLDHFYTFYEQFISEHFFCDTLPEIDDTFEAVFTGHYRTHLQVLALGKTSRPHQDPEAPPPPPHLPPRPAFTADRPLIPRRAPSIPLITTINDPITTITPPPPASPLPWKTMGKGKGNNKPRSFAAAAASKPRRPAQTNSSVPLPANRSTNLTDAQLNVMTRVQLITAYETRFHTKVNAPNASKESIKFAYKHALNHEASAAALSTTNSAPPQQARPNRPRPRPVVTTEFTITRDPAARALGGACGDPAAIVRSLQTSLRQTGIPSSNPPVTLLSGRWSSQLSSNFVLTFAGQPSNDSILRLRKILCSPFGPSSTLIPQCGYTRVAVHSVPVLYDENGNRPSSDDLWKELEPNPACNGLMVISPPKWLRSSIDAEKSHSSILFAFLDEDGSRLARLTKSPLFLFGSPCIAKLFSSLPLVRQCDRCHKLGHSTERCRAPKNAVICPVCGGKHTAHDHAHHCPTGKNHTDLYCRCPVSCINCIAAHLPGKGHISRDPACPLRKNYRRDTNRTSNASEAEIDRPMMVDAHSVAPTVPPSQPSDDEQIVFRPATAAAQIDDPPKPATLPNLSAGALLHTEMQRWHSATLEYFRSLSVAELTSLPPNGLAHMRAFQLGTSIADIIKSLPNA